ncbi:MAG TPA: methyltransferase domain-containing protein [Bryobacteraceae bacterium]|nr:methyltransferase domain-containing protein [Bryobacteraceae bacterium]
MSDSIRLQTIEGRTAQQTKSKSCLLAVIRRFVQACNVDTSEPVLVMGGGQEDLEMLSACGFSQIVMSNIDTAIMALDAENIALPDDSYPVVFAHAVLHHCRSPQRALGEMVRVSQRHVFFLEPNDSWALRLLVRLGYSFPYELAAVADNEYIRGGLRNGPIPNYIYRWTSRDVEKSVRAYHPERAFDILAYSYWDFYVNENDLLLRKESRVASLAQRMGPRNLLSLLHLAQSVLNWFSLTRSPGNKFFCSISKKDLQPWIEARNGEYGLKRNS